MNNSPFITQNSAEIPQVATYADLPPAATHYGALYYVTTQTGYWLINLKPMGMYRSNGLTWIYGGDLDDEMAARQINTTTPLQGGGDLTADRTVSITQASASTSGYLSSNDWNVFNNKLDPSRFNYITNPDAEIDASDWSMYNDAGRTTPASYLEQDILWVSTAGGNSGNVNASTGDVLVSTIGKGLQVKTGTNAKIGTAVLVGGTVTVANTSVTANSRIFLTSQVDGGTPGFLRVTAKVVGTSFTITSSSATDTSTIAWTIIESIP